MHLNLPVRPEGLQVTEGSSGSLLLGTILKRTSDKTLLYALWPVPYTSNGTPWIVVPGMYGTHCKHYSLIPLLESNNNLDLLRCRYICAKTLVHIPRHLGRTNNRCQDNNSLSCFATRFILLVLPYLLSSDFTSDFWFMIIIILYY